MWRPSGTSSDTKAKCGISAAADIFGNFWTSFRLPFPADRALVCEQKEEKSTTPPLRKPRRSGHPKKQKSRGRVRHPSIFSADGPLNREQREEKSTPPRPIRVRHPRKSSTLRKSKDGILAGVVSSRVLETVPGNAGSRATEPESMRISEQRPFAIWEWLIVFGCVVATILILRVAHVGRQREVVSEYTVAVFAVVVMAFRFAWRSSELWQSLGIAFFVHLVVVFVTIQELPAAIGILFHGIALPIMGMVESLLIGSFLWRTIRKRATRSHLV